ncbi:hypothetical protein ACI1US_00909 [Leucobacter sp. BZR 635]
MRTEGAAARTRPAQADLVYAADLRIGQQMELGTYEVESAELVEFAAQWDPQWFHTDSEAAQKGLYGGLIASGVQTLAILTRLTYEAAGYRWAMIAGRGMRELRFSRPVRPGDRLTGTVTVTDIAFDERDRALVTTANTLVEQHGKPVLTVQLEVYLHARAPQPESDSRH